MNSFSLWHWLVVAIIWLLIAAIIVLPCIIGIAVMGWQRTVLVKHEQSGLTKTGYVGYSLTYFFAGWLVPIVRGEIGIGVLHLVLTVVSFGTFQFLIMPYLYNKQYMTRLLTQGWQLHDTEENTQYARRKLGISV
jgi:hypothetical protein